MARYLAADALEETFSSTDYNVARVRNKMVEALKPGTATLKNSRAIIEVTVEPAVKAKLFELPYLNNNASIAMIKSNMHVYTLAYEGDADYNGKTYTALRYKPYGEGFTLTYYFDEFYTSSILKYVILETDRVSAVMYSYLLSYYEPYLSGVGNDVSYFSIGNSYWRITSVNNSWSTLSFIFM